jgi:hypothetical protein
MEIFMHALSVASLALCLSVTGVFAASAQSPLPAGKPAGISQAQMVSTSSLLIVGGIAAFAGVFAVIADNQGNTNAPVSTSTAP